jgi:hypothetical protein
LEYAVTGDAGQSADILPLVGLRHVPKTLGTVVNSDASTSERLLAAADVGLAVWEAVAAAKGAKGLTSQKAPESFGAAGRGDNLLPSRPPKRVYHQGDLTNGVSTNRPLSTSPDPDLRHYNPDGNLHQFDIPATVYDEWMFDGTIQTFNDLHLPSGNIRPEIRITPPNSGQMNDFLAPPSGGG